jgi:hypothetical protein
VSRRDLRGLYPDVIGELARDPNASANEIDARLRVAGRGWARGDVLRAVRTLRSLPGVAPSTRGPGRPEKPRVPFVRLGSDGVEEPL